MSDPWNDPEWKAYVTHVRTTLVPMVADSSIGVSLVPTDPKNFDVKFAVELGTMIMLDKPLIMVVPIGTELPRHLRRVADAIIFGDATRSPAREELMDAMRRLGVEVQHEED